MLPSRSRGTSARIRRRVATTATPLIDAMDSIRARSAQETFNHGHALQARGDFEGAMAAYTDVLDIDPGYAQAHVNLVAIHGELGNYEQAAAHYEHSVKLAPSIAEAHYNYGVSRHFGGRLPRRRRRIRKGPRDQSAGPERARQPRCITGRARSLKRGDQAFQAGD